MTSMNLLTRTKNRRTGRSGVTIVEVLTSIIVAVIGVAGVLVLIPFGIRQAQVGLDLQDSTTVAENAAQEFQIRGYGKLGRYQGERAMPWIEVARGGLANQATPPSDGSGFNLLRMTSDPMDPIGWYLIDPLWLNSQVDPSNANNLYPYQETVEAMFHYVGTDSADSDAFFDGVPNMTDPALFDQPPGFPRYAQLVDLTDPFDDPTADPPVVNPMSLGMADRIFRSRDNIQFAVETIPDGHGGQSGGELDELLPPAPYLDVAADGTTPLRRQFEGDISWSAVAVPKRSPGNVDLLSVGGDGQRIEGFDFYVMVFKDRSFDDPTSFADDRDPRFIFTTLDTTLGPTSIFGTGTITLDAAGVDIRNDDWVMLLNFDTRGQSQVGFYRVIGSYENAITIDGSDFVVNDGFRSQTFVIYLPRVVNVFKRQLIIERESGL